VTLSLLAEVGLLVGAAILVDAPGTADEKEEEEEEEEEEEAEEEEVDVENLYPQGHRSKYFITPLQSPQDQLK
jgi:hypothetical protein